MAEHGAGIRTADRGWQPVALGHFLDQAGIGAGQILDRNLIGPGGVEIDPDPRIGRLPARLVGGRADQAAVLKDKNLEIRGSGAVCLIPLQQQRHVVAGSFGIDRNGLNEAAPEAFRIGESNSIE